MRIQNSVNSAAIVNAERNKGVAAGKQNTDRQTRVEDNSTAINASTKQQPITFDAQAVAKFVEQRQESKSGYDEPPEKNRLAIQAYIGVNDIEKREAVQQVLGVDLFA